MTLKRKPPYRPRRRRSPEPSRGISPRRQTTGFRFKWRWLAFFLILIPSVGYVSLLDVKIREQFEGKRWALPARVYARPLELYTGMRLSPTRLIEELTELGYRATEHTSEPGQYERNSNEILIKTRAFRFWDAKEAVRLVRVEFSGETITSINELHPYRNLVLLRLEPQLIGKIYPNHHEDRILVPFQEVPKDLVDALIAMEDRDFYDHYGISIRGIARAFIANLRAGSWVQGGSTLTQQLVKNFYLTNERTFIRKINEAIMSLLLEWHYSKEQILEAYLNEVFLGQDGKRAIHGMGMAARFYFGRPLEELKLPELTLLVSLIRGASVYNPRKNSQSALDRRNLVLDKMAELELLTLREAEIAKTAPLGVTQEPSVVFFPIRHLLA
jgi:penicillin-binding protein 1B